VTKIKDCFIKPNVDIAAVSGWLQRLVRWFGDAIGKRAALGIQK